MPRKGENIYKRKDGRWEGRYMKSRNPDGKAKYGSVYAKSYNEVKAKLNDISYTEKESVGKNADYRYFEDFARSWIDISAGRLKESTCLKYSNLLRLYILPYWGKKNIFEVNQANLEVYCNQITTSGGKNKQGLSDKTVSDIVSVIKSIIRYANIKGVSVSAEVHFHGKKDFSHHMRVLSRLEQEKLCNYLYSNLNLYNIGILICLFTGLRVGELCALKWEDIQIDEQVIYVHQTMQRIHTDDKDAVNKTKILISTPKSPCSIRYIPIPQSLADIIVHVQPNHGGFFLTGSENKFVEPRTMQNRFKAALRESNIADANFHSLRHTFATRCIEFGFDVKSLSEILGHANVNITMNRYVHPTMQFKRENMQRLSSLLAVK